jgi:hypothetical protein
MRRWSFFVYSVLCHLRFLATFAYMAGFAGNFLVAKSIDSAPADFLYAVGVDLMLVGLFALQHSIMARPWKANLDAAGLATDQAERVRTYFMRRRLRADVAVAGIETVVSEVQRPVRRGLLWRLFAAGWLLVFAASLMINHFDLFGTRQV